MSSTTPQRPSKFSRGFPVDFVRENIGIFAYYAVMIALFELVMVDKLSPVLGGGMRAVYLYSAYLNIKSRVPKYLAAHGSFPGDQAALRGVGSALMAAAGLCLYNTFEDYMASKR